MLTRQGSTYTAAMSNSSVPVGTGAISVSTVPPSTSKKPRRKSVGDAMAAMSPRRKMGSSKSSAFEKSASQSDSVSGGTADTNRSEALTAERPKQVEGDAGHSCVLHPHSDFRVYWDAISMVFLLFNVVVVPLRSPISLD